jgi:hypothetical protein
MTSQWLPESSSTGHSLEGFGVRRRGRMKGKDIKGVSTVFVNY